VDAVALERFLTLIERRGRGFPIAYLIHRQEFFGREFYVDERVLIPRADTEILIETALRVADEDPSLERIHDLGTGSGCIALTLKAERPALLVSASDISHDACEVFRINAGRLGLELPLTEAPFFRSLNGPFDIVVSNAPYLTDNEVQAMDARGWPEPQGALRAGNEGLDCIEQIIAESVHYLRESGRLILEAAPAQMPIISEMMRRAGFGGLTVGADLAGRDRVVSGVRNG